MLPLSSIPVVPDNLPLTILQARLRKLNLYDGGRKKALQIRLIIAELDFEQPDSDVLAVLLEYFHHQARDLREICSQKHLPSDGTILHMRRLLIWDMIQRNILKRKEEEPRTETDPALTVQPPPTVCRVKVETSPERLARSASISRSSAPEESKIRQGQVPTVPRSYDTQNTARTNEQVPKVKVEEALQDEDEIFMPPAPDQYHSSAKSRTDKKTKVAFKEEYNQADEHILRAKDGRGTSAEGSHPLRTKRSKTPTVKKTKAGKKKDASRSGLASMLSLQEELDSLI